jgi:hypothetical protein
MLRAAQTYPRPSLDNSREAIISGAGGLSGFADAPTHWP